MPDSNDDPIVATLSPEDMEIIAERAYATARALEQAEGVEEDSLATWADLTEEERTLNTMMAQVMLTPEPRIPESFSAEDGQTFLVMRDLVRAEAVEFMLTRDPGLADEAEDALGDTDG